MTEFKAVRRLFEAEMRLSAAPEKVFPLLCPVREYDWIPHWKCEMVWSESGIAEEDCIFRTWFPGRGGKETWMVCRYEPNETIEFVRFNTSLAVRYRIRLGREGDITTAHWSQLQTGLDEMGNTIIENTSPETYAALMKSIKEMLEHYLRTGEMLVPPHKL